MHPLKAASTLSWIPLLLIGTPGCGPETPTAATPQTYGELQVIVTSVTGPGIDPDRVGVGIAAVSLGTPQLWGDVVFGLGTPLTLRVPTGPYEVRTYARATEPTRVGFPHYCDASRDFETVIVAENQRSVLERAFVCARPGGVQVRTSITGVDPYVQLKVQLAATAGLCDLVNIDSGDPHSPHPPELFPMYPVAATTYGPLRPGPYRMNVCGLPEGCPTAGASQAFVVREDELTDVLFAIRCEGDPDPS